MIQPSDRIQKKASYSNSVRLLKKIMILFPAQAYLNHFHNQAYLLSGHAGMPIVSRNQHNIGNHIRSMFSFICPDNRSVNSIPFIHFRKVISFIIKQMETINPFTVKGFRACHEN